MSVGVNLRGRLYTYVGQRDGDAIGHLDTLLCQVQVRTTQGSILLKRFKQHFIEVLSCQRLNQDRRSVLFQSDLADEIVGDEAIQIIVVDIFIWNDDRAIHQAGVLNVYREMVCSQLKRGVYDASARVGGDVLVVKTLELTRAALQAVCRGSWRYGRSFLLCRGWDDRLDRSGVRHRLCWRWRVAVTVQQDHACQSAYQKVSGNHCLMGQYNRI